MKLVIGNKNYSSWSLRPWLLLSHFKVPFEEVSESLRAVDLSRRLGEHSPSHRVPVLIDDHLTIWDSLAICEYANENMLKGMGWPQSIEARAYARSISAEMHAGFNALRNAMPMNIRAKRRVTIDSAVERDLQRIDEIFSKARMVYREHGTWLAGPFSIADCMYAPVVSRLQTYGVKLSPLAEEYCHAMLNLPALQAWYQSALVEKEIVEEDEAGEDV